MKKTRFLLSIVILLPFFECCTTTQKIKTPTKVVSLAKHTQSSTNDKLRYLGQTAPSTTPELFALNIISKPDRHEFGCTFSADGKELFFGVDNEGIMEIYHTKLENGAWSASEKLFKRDTFSNNDPMLSPDENKLFFISNRPLEPSQTKKDIDIWYIERTEKEWSNPINLGTPVNNELDQYYASFTANETLYFASKSTAKEAPRYAFDIYRSELENGKYAVPQKLPTEINTNRYEADVFVAPDESYLIFCAIRKDGYGKGDLYISFKDGDGKWTPSKNMGPAINTENHELCPFVSKDGKYLFFTSNQDIYWVSSEIIKN